MKKITYLLFLALGVTACSVESLDSAENLTVADATIQVAQDPMGFYTGNGKNLKGSLSVWNDCDNLYVEILPAGDAPDDAELGLFSTLPALNNGGNLDQELEFDLNDASNLKWAISLATLDTEEELIIFAKAWGDWAGTIVYDRQEYSTYEFDFSACTCEESFTYSENEDGSYTFTYIPAEDMAEAEVVFTFAQSVVATGYEWPNWNGTSSTRTEFMDLEACETYIWTVSLTPDCSGNTASNNVWTDFKVAGESKKNDATPTIKKTC